MQERGNSIAKALELHISCTKPSICQFVCVALSSVTNMSLSPAGGDPGGKDFNNNPRE